MPKNFKELSKLVATAPPDLSAPIDSSYGDEAVQAAIDDVLRERYGMLLKHLGIDPFSPFAAAAALNLLLPLIFDGFCVRPEKRGRKPYQDEAYLRAHALYRQVTGKSRYEPGDGAGALTADEWVRIVQENERLQERAFPLTGSAREIDTARDWLRKAQVVIDARSSVYASSNSGLIRRSGSAPPLTVGEMIASKVEVASRSRAARPKKQRAK